MSVRTKALVKSLVWFLVLTLVCVFAWMRLDLRAPVDTNLLDLLPAAQQSPLQDAAKQQTQAAFLGDLLLVVGSPDYSRARRAAEAARTALKAAGLPLDDTAKGSQTLIALYHQHHYVFLTATDRQQLNKDPVGAFTNEVAGEFVSPVGMAGVSGNDPGGYLGRFLMALPSPYPNFTPDGAFMSAQHDGVSYFLLRVSLPEAALGEQGAMHAAAAVVAVRAVVKQVCQDCRVLATGAALFSAVAQDEAKQEVFWLTTASLLFIMLLILLVFRSLQPLLLGVLSVAAGVLAGAATVVICFSSIHILTLVCGTTLLGVAIDYAFLYFAEHWFGGGAPEHTLNSVIRGLTMGLITGVIAFAFLLLAGFPALTQIAIFSVVGLIFSYATVLLVFPLLLRRRPAFKPGRLLQLPEQLLAWASRPAHWRYFVPSFLLLLCIPGWLQLRTSDDLRDLQNFPKNLVNTDQRVHALLGQMQSPGFFLITGNGIQQALQREETLFNISTGAFPDATALGLSRFLPSRARQQMDLNAWASVYAEPAALKQAFAHIGLPPEYAGTLETDWKNDPRTLMAPQMLFTAEPEFDQFVVRTGGQLALIATLLSYRGTAQSFENIAAQVPGVSFVAPLQRLTEVFRGIRLRATWLVVAGYLLISLLLVWRYGRRESLRMLYPPLLSLAVTLGALGWLHVAVNIFVIVGLILVLGVGRDYTVFLREGAESRSTALGVTLGALTTLCSFGMLVFSAIPALHAFGLATLIGILASYLSAPLSISPVTRDVA